ncbi:glycosyltransferase family 2 protein [Cryobacterium arcticum]|uniref:Glycosyl transferase n=1 Tax=Cryobacterium arcticum TaxID=670052 RepID=A0A1B1BNI8_9MICO|nr:glycosyltransferase family 2 protein [Cryobacterium arcticum]ANP74091.1 glycosyl transferase [Cryobacterium arcticum]
MTDTASTASDSAGSPTPVLDCAIILVAYDSDEDIPRLLDSLPAAAADLSYAVLIVDNKAATSRITALVGQRPRVTVIDAGGNLGYSGGLNVGLAHAPAAEATLFLNPDLVLGPGSIVALLRESRSNGAAVPVVLDTSGRRQLSLRREPTLGRALGDALFGDRWPRRPGWLSETVRQPKDYLAGHDAQWATGAALMVQNHLISAVGGWDAERYFLYSEETDYCRRIRATGASIRFCPAAQVTHAGGGSGSSPALDALLQVNKVRYFRKWHGGAATGSLTVALFWAVAVLHGLLRPHNPGARLALRALMSPRARATLPARSSLAIDAPVESDAGDGRLQPDSDRSPADPDPVANVIIAAYNEEAVIGRTLAALGDLAPAGRIRVIVVCNGCTDRTAAIARGFNGVRVVELDQASKVLALRAGDLLAGPGPRIYLDADVVMTCRAVRDTARLLEGDVTPAARPPVHFDSTAASWPMRRWYVVRAQLPTISSRLWGAGAYALSESGRARFGEFPELVSDDTFIDALFADNEITIVPTEPVAVRIPRTTADLMKIMRRSYRTQSEVIASAGRPTFSAGQRGQVRDLVALLVRHPTALVDVALYVTIVALARVLAARARYTTWERDESSRV